MSDRPDSADIKAGAWAQYAARLARAGYSPLPIKPGEKRPLYAQWSDYCTRQMPARQIVRIAEHTPNAGLGVALGYAGVIALDIDTDDADVMAAIRTVVPESPVAKRGAKGRTDFYSAGGEIAARKLKPVVEVLASGNQSVIPPTLHPDTGAPYEWLGGSALWDVAPAELPPLEPDIAARLEEVLAPWLPKRAEAPESARLQPRAPDKPLEERERRRLEAYAGAALERRARELGAMGKDSGRNIALFQAACALGKYVWHGVLSESAVKSALAGACDANGLAREDGRRSVEATMQSGFKAAVKDDLPALPDNPRYSPNRACAPPAERPFHTDGDRRGAQAIWKEARPLRGTLAEDYLRIRGVDLNALRAMYGQDAPADLRFHPSVKYDQDGHRYSGPVMIGALRALDGAITGVHCTWIKAEGRAESPPKVVIGDIWGAAGWLTPVCATALMGEGYETALVTASRLARAGRGPYCVISALSLGNMAGAKRRARRRVWAYQEPDPERPGLVLPEGVTGVILLRDADWKSERARAANAAAYDLAVAKFRAGGRWVREAQPRLGCDFADMAMEAV